ncbi:class II aldolase/adducin family protein [Asticcacaulis endophyticus]|uniref:Ribulose-5-phosphate 4-epimerase n=1 Tax=Asticcacaulis endophyticus TaxID=1395890 RepID=A0A918Q1X2_9CAUL|nr:class II aldolase/adducin family protein [Asticcacaulis endophyticus]GGZ28410.1 ribulose-5-phosphate 4-epimerase [Asticcacaulis endophyticus]
MTTLSQTVLDFVEQVKTDAAIAFKGLRDTHTISPAGTVNFVQRVPDEHLIVSIGYPGPFAPDSELKPAVYDFDGNLLLGEAKNAGGGGRYLPIFRKHDDITTVSHVHSVYLGAWSQSHRTLPIRYVPVQRWTRIRELPVYIDRRQGEANYILERLEEDNSHFAILEANGGSTVWGRKGILALANTIVNLEEGARLQAIAETLGGSKLYGPGVLEQQWKMSGLWRPEDEVAVAAE